jgi:hypothetical protein
MNAPTMADHADPAGAENNKRNSTPANAPAMIG